MSKRYVIGIDFGTLSARAVLVDSTTGRVAASAVADYPHGVIEAFQMARRKVEWYHVA